MTLLDMLYSFYNKMCSTDGCSKYISNRFKNISSVFRRDNYLELLKYNYIM